MEEDVFGILLWMVLSRLNHQLLGPVSQNLSSVINDSLCYKLLKSLVLIGYQQICHWFLSVVIEKRLMWNGSLDAFIPIGLMQEPITTHVPLVGNDKITSISHLAIADKNVQAVLDTLEPVGIHVHVHFLKTLLKGEKGNIIGEILIFPFSPG